MSVFVIQFKAKWSPLRTVYWCGLSHISLQKSASVTFWGRCGLRWRGVICCLIKRTVKPADCAFVCKMLLYCHSSSILDTQEAARTCMSFLGPSYLEVELNFVKVSWWINERRCRRTPGSSLQSCLMKYARSPPQLSLEWGWNVRWRLRWLKFLWVFAFHWALSAVCSPVLQQSSLGGVLV